MSLARSPSIKHRHEWSKWWHSFLQWKRVWSLRTRKGESHGNKKKDLNGLDDVMVVNKLLLILHTLNICFPTLAIEML